MRYQNRDSARGPRRTGERGGNRRFGERRGRGGRDDRPQRFRRGSRDFGRQNERDFVRRNDEGTNDRKIGDRVRRRIARDPRGKSRISRVDKRDDTKKPRDLDGELMNYWVKAGKKQDDEGKHLAQQKLNQQMQNYWKKKEQTGQKVQQKPKN